VNGCGYRKHRNQQQRWQYASRGELSNHSFSSRCRVADRRAPTERRL
jgi:hypothetical protein